MTPPPLQDDTRTNLLNWSSQPAAAARTRPNLTASAGTRWRAQVSQGIYLRYGKRTLDLVLGTLLLIGSLPLMAGTAVAVLLTSGWPIFYRAERLGRHGRPFHMWKFRTMVRDADHILQRWHKTNADLATKYEEEFKLKDDPRVTTFGRFLRKTSLDELPQLWNVMRGEMSLVGPRPLTETEVGRFGEHAGTLLSLRPGLSGRWQTNGRNHVRYPDRMSMELEYCRSVKLLGDTQILLKTLVAPFHYDGV